MRTHRIHKSKRGMTLVEIMLSTALLSVVGIAITGLLMSSMTGWSSGTSNEITTNSVTIAMQKLSTEIRDGQSATVSDGKLIVTFPGQLVDGATGETIYDLSASSTTRSYYVSNGNLVRSENETVSILARGVSTAEFGATGGTVNATLISDEQIGTYESSREITGRIALRNHRD